ncbi:MAG: RNA-guided endonuclease InsQ/TnpB family protein, partial [Thermoplasmata archaeon]
MIALKSITQPYTPSENVFDFMHKFIDGINLCINIALEKNLTSRYSLSREAYPLLKEYGIPSYYYPEMINKA